VFSSPISELKQGSLLKEKGERGFVVFGVSCCFLFWNRDPFFSEWIGLFCEILVEIRTPFSRICSDFFFGFQVDTKIRTGLVEIVSKEEEGKGMQIGFCSKIGLDTDRSWTDLEKGGLLMMRNILRFTIQRGENWNMEIAVVDMKKIRVLVEHLDLEELQEITT
jgi:hypothetical protein